MNFFTKNIKKNEYFWSDELQEECDVAASHKRDGRYEESIRIYEELDEKYPNNPAIYKAWAKTITASGDYDSGLEYFKKAKSLYEYFDNEIGKASIYDCEYFINILENTDRGSYEFLEFLKSISGNRDYKIIENSSKEKFSVIGQTPSFGSPFIDRNPVSKNIDNILNNIVDIIRKLGLIHIYCGYNKINFNYNEKSEVGSTSLLGFTELDVEEALSVGEAYLCFIAYPIDNEGDLLEMSDYYSGDDIEGLIKKAVGLKVVPLGAIYINEMKLRTAKFIVSIKEDSYNQNNSIDNASSLITASISGDFNAVKKFIENGQDVNAADNNGITSLMWAVNEGNLNIAKELIKAGADLETKDKDADLLSCATINNDIEMVRELINAGCNVDVKLSYGMTPLMLASQRRNIDIIRMLVDAGVDLDAQDDNGITALMISSGFGYLEIVKELANAGANVNLKNNVGTNALIGASMRGNLDIIKELIKFGSDLDEKNNNGETALSRAKYNDHLDCAEELIRAGSSN